MPYTYAPDLCVVGGEGVIALSKPRETEAGIQATAVEALRTLGYIVLVTSAHIRGASHATGNDKGIPDLLVAHRDWPAALWLGVEMKTPSGKLRIDQKRLWAEGRIVVARSAKEVVWRVREAETETFGRIYGGKGEVR